MMTVDLASRKRQFIRDTIYDAAIDLFVKKGFEETTVDEIAEAAGISKRSFFRYFESKDDLLAMNVVANGEQICKAVASCPQNLNLQEVVRQAVFAGVSFTQYQPRTRSIIDIGAKSATAMQAQFSRLRDEQDKLAAILAIRMKSPSQLHLAPHLIAGLIWTLIIASTVGWYQGEFSDIHKAADEAFVIISRLLNENHTEAHHNGAREKVKTAHYKPKTKLRKLG